MTNRETLIAYLTMKVAEQDWHGVADAAMDLRELDAEYRGADKSAKLLIGNGLVNPPEYLHKLA